MTDNSSAEWTTLIFDQTGHCTMGLISYIKLQPNTHYHGMDDGRQFPNLAVVIYFYRWHVQEQV